ncbi:MAG: hypothetical protein SWI22_02300 [Pseudomonadota bacterium]|nr:hypothetical protein [Pseudomonadota bacterium]
MTDLSRVEVDILKTLVAVGPDCGLCFRHIIARGGLTDPRGVIEAAVRLLAARGFVLFRRGMWTDDGEPYGSGYSINAEGMKALGLLPAAGVA